MALSCVPLLCASDGGERRVGEEVLYHGVGEDGGRRGREEGGGRRVVSVDCWGEVEKSVGGLDAVSAMVSLEPGVVSLVDRCESASVEVAISCGV